MHTVAEGCPAGGGTPQPAGMRALQRWFPWCNARVALAVRTARLGYPLIQGDLAQSRTLESQPMPSFDDGGRAA